MQDLFTVPGMTQPISTPFGCISSMNKEMVAEGVDGIWGVGRSDTNKDGVAQYRIIYVDEWTNSLLEFPHRLEAVLEFWHFAWR